MSRLNPAEFAARLPIYALLFAALGDETRLSLVAQLSQGQPRSIAQLTEGSQLTRQAVTKHLQVLERAGLVQSHPEGRENRFELDTRPFEDMTEYLGFVSEQWENALGRLQAFLAEEEEEGSV